MMGYVQLYCELQQLCYQLQMGEKVEADAGRWRDEVWWREAVAVGWRGAATLVGGYKEAEASSVVRRETEAAACGWR